MTLARHLDPRITTESGAAEIERRSETVKAVTDALLQRAPAEDVAGGHQALQNAITELFAAWGETARAFEGDAFSYSQDKRLLSYPLDPRNQGLSPSHRRFEAARSMRDVEPNVALKLRDPYGGSVRD